MKKIFLVTICLFVFSSLAEAKTTHIAYLVFDKMNILDFAGPREVFNEAARALELENSPDTLKFYTIGYPSKNITTVDGTQITADYLLSEAPAPDVLILPGGDIRTVVQAAEVIDWIKDNALKNKTIMSVCTGAYLIAQTGVLDGKSATTHHFAFDDFKKTFPKINLREDMRFVDEGNITTTAGVSAGIDGALHLTIRMYGKTIAEKAARAMEYDWNPKLQK